LPILDQQAREKESRVDCRQSVRSNGIKQLYEKVLPFDPLTNKNIFLKCPAVAGIHLRMHGIQIT